MTSLIEIYETLAQKGEIKKDPAQEACLPMLEGIRTHLEAAPNRKRGRFAGLFQGKPEEGPKGLYLWGGVGRGKSMLMDLFVDHVNITEKRRVHFHAFMQEVHERMADARKADADDPLSKVAAQIAVNVRLFAFDEMQISDITDAMIVGRLFEKFFEAGVIVVTTSNRHPDDLYKDGLNRQLFLPFIELIKEHMISARAGQPK